MKRAIITIVIITGLLSVAAPGPISLTVERPDKDSIFLKTEKMTFRRISPRQYGTNSTDFFLLETEVTNEMYQQYLKATGKSKADQELVDAERKRSESGGNTWNSAAPIFDLDNPALLWRNNSPPVGRYHYPVALLTIGDAKAFCQWLNLRYPGEGVFRLPTVEEWLLAAYGDKRKYPWGDEWSFDIPWVSVSQDKQRSAPKPVKAQTKDKTPEGIYDLWGNVQEFVLDSKGFPNGTRWMGPSFKSYPLEGEKELFPFTARNDWWGFAHSSESRSEDMGFRVLLEPNQLSE